MNARDVKDTRRPTVAFLTLSGRFDVRSGPTVLGKAIAGMNAKSQSRRCASHGHQDTDSGA